MDNEKLYNPIYIKAEKEYIPGVGRKELMLIAIFVTAVFIISFIMYQIKGNLASTMLFFMIGVAVSFFLNVKNEANLSVLMFIFFMFKYVKEQQMFMYKYQKEWE
ncbi:MAG: hypothetical protein HFG28_06810 [Eubacterium sp.]|nr:hypothetical protein [Eubacterium sp.]